MKSKKFFSIIEMMTVVLIVLLLLSLSIPVFVNLKMNAKTAICKNHLHQLGVLFTSYQTDQNGYLPNDEAYTWHLDDNTLCGYSLTTCKRKHITHDIPETSKGSNAYYRNWNGHLLPYLNFNLPDKYTRQAMVTKVGTTRYDPAQLGGPANKPPADVLKNGWIVVDDALQVGGYQDLKTFICPEIHGSTFDVAAAIKFNGVQIPRIQQLCTGGVTSQSAFRDSPGFTYGMTGGVPTTYLANELFFGEGVRVNSKRVDEISQYSEKVLLIEGGLADAYGDGSNGAIGSVYYSVAGWNGDQYDGGDLTSSDILRPDKGQFQKLSYVHDNQDKFWIMNSQMYILYFPNMNRDYGMEVATKFNQHFEGKAYMASGTNTSSGFIGFSIVSFIDPGNLGDTFKDFFASLSITYPKNYTPFIDDQNDYKYLTGKMNVLLGDGSVSTKDQAWLCNNRRKIGMLSKE